MDKHHLTRRIMRLSHGVLFVVIVIVTIVWR